MNPQPAKMKPPQQLRSHESLERCLDAAEALIRESGFDTLTITQVVNRAGFSVGGLYSRFRNKGALLEAVMERFLARIEDGIRYELEREREIDESLPEAVRRLITALFNHLLAERELFRAFVLESPHDAFLLMGGERSNARRRTSVIRALMVHRDEIKHPNPELAARYFYSFCMAQIRERVVYGEAANITGEFPDEELIQQMTVTMVAYLTRTDTC